jgi:hypothetical protein
MLIKEKLDHFVNGFLSDSKELSVNQLVDVGVSSNQNNLKGTYIERGAILSSSPILGSGNLFIGAYSYMNGGGGTCERVF